MAFTYSSPRAERLRALVVGLAAVAVTVGLAAQSRAAPPTGGPTVWYVGTKHKDPPSGKCPTNPNEHHTLRTIAFALGCATDGDTISLAAGSYDEHVTISKDVTLVGAGAGSSVIGGGAFGPVVTVDAGASPTISDVSIAGGTVGLLVNGGLSGSGFEISGAGDDGMVIDSGEAISVRNFDIHHNGGDGLLIERVSGPQAVFGGDRPTVRSLSKIHDNGGNGVSVGSAYVGVAPPIDVYLGDQDVFANGGTGVRVADDGGTGRRRVAMADDDVWSNGSNGVYFGRSTLTFYAQNKVHFNGANQMVFDGGGGPYPSWEWSINSPTDQCDAGANAVYAYRNLGVLGMFAQGNASVTVRHTHFEGGPSNMDFSAESGSTISVDQSCTAITVYP